MRIEPTEDGVEGVLAHLGDPQVNGRDFAQGHGDEGAQEVLGRDARATHLGVQLGQDGESRGQIQEL